MEIRFRIPNLVLSSCEILKALLNFTRDHLQDPSSWDLSDSRRIWTFPCL